jgi:hypothetical protein
MRSLATSLIALVVSLIVGGIITQLLAVSSDGREEWIVAFGMTILVSGAVTFVFLIVQLVSGSRWAAGFAALVLLAVFVFVIGTVVWSIFASEAEPSSDDLSLTAGLVLPGISIILIQWLIVRWRAPATPGLSQTPRFGRGGQPS